MRAYIGAKIITATPMMERQFVNEIKGEAWSEDRPNRRGYLVVYPDGYQSWSPAGTFETAYREVSNDERRLIAESPAP